MAKIILTRGIPASGKSTWAKAWVAEDPDHRFRVNRDNLRWTLGIKTGIGTPAQEEEVTYWEERMAQQAIQTGKDVVVDATNLRAKFVKEWLRRAAAWGAEVEFIDFPISFAEALYRDDTRKANGERFVGVDVIETFFKKFIKGGVQGSALPSVPTIEGEVSTIKFAPYVEQPGLDYCIIVDIDGTLAHMQGRSPYDPTLYHTDSFDHVIGLLAEAYAVAYDRAIILLSGRDEGHREETEKWLALYYFDYDALYMRPEGDTRNDAIVKNELFEKYIVGKYNVDFVLDDRDRVVAMWRAKGLKVLQVAEGNF